MRKNNTLLKILSAFLAVILAGMMIFALSLDRRTEGPSLSATGTSTGPTQSTPTGPTETDPKPTDPKPTDPLPTDPLPTDPLPTDPLPTDPPVYKETTAAIGAIGDILMHGPVIDTGRTGDGYDFHAIFTELEPYISALDYAAANMEGTLCGTKNGYKYGGWPTFNCPDAIAEALKDSGFDLLLTANNHSFDTKKVGLLRTQEVISGLGLDCTGTVTEAGADNYLVKEINGISIGMVCWTYNQGFFDDGRINFNAIPVTTEDAKLINTFHYGDLDSFYQTLTAQRDGMIAAGAEATVIYIHWGTEYQLSPNATQKQIAQQLCDLGFDVIVGGHPHVIQPMELLTSSDGSRKTVCIYSLGNAVSNQRQGKLSSIKTAHTEDGALFSVTFAKYSDGTVLVETVELLPLWVNMNSNSGKKVYQIVPLDAQTGDWQAAFGLTDSQLDKAQASYDRTMELVGQGLADAQSWYRENQAQIEAALGVTE